MWKLRRKVLDMSESEREAEKPAMGPTCGIFLLQLP